MCSSLNKDPSLKLLVPKEADCNVATLLEKVTTSGQATSLATLTSLTEELFSKENPLLRKATEQGLESWLRIADEKFVPYANHGHELKDEMKTIIITNKIASDQRYMPAMGNGARHDGKWRPTRAVPLRESRRRLRPQKWPKQLPRSCAFLWSGALSDLGPVLLPLCGL